TVCFDEIESPVVRRNLNTVWPLNIRCAENPRQFSGSIDSIDGPAIEIREVEPPFAINRDVIRSDQGLSFVLLRQDLHLSGLEVLAGHARLACHRNSISLCEIGRASC